MEHDALAVAHFLKCHAQAVSLELHAGASHRRENSLVAASSDQAWTADDTARALRACPYDEHIGLKFYHDDPLLQIRGAAGPKNMFVDYEFSTNKEVILNGKQRIAPGIISCSDCKDFISAGPKRATRVEHFVEKAESAWRWVRGSSIQESALFAYEEGSIDPRNVLQGSVGNCGFCSGFASLACDFPATIRDAFGEYSEICISECGAFSIRLYPKGQKRYLLLDDYILCRRNSKASPSLHCLESRDLWIRLLEKVFVKLQASYAALDGLYKYKSLYRHPARVLQMLTGAPLAMEIHYSSNDTSNVYDMLLASQNTCARVVHCRKRVHGLHANHGYSLLWVGEAAGVRLACLRNPHGRGSFTGEYGFGRRAGWEGERHAKVASELVALNDCFVFCNKTKRVTWSRLALPVTTRGDNGIFFIDFATFVECFPITTIVGPLRKETYDSSQAEVPDCIYRIKSSKIPFLTEILSAEE